MKKNDRSDVHTDMQSEICLGFDKMKQFVKYNPRFNFSSVISRFNHLQDQRRRLLYKKGNRSSKIRQTVQLRNSVFKNSDSQFNLDLRKSSKNATALAYQNTVLQNLDGESFSSKYVNGNTNFAQIFDIDSSGLKDSNQRVSEKDLTQLDQITINLNQINAMSENISVLNSKYSPQKDSMYQPSDLNNSQNYEIIEESKLSCIPYSFKKRKSNFQHNLNEFN